MSRPHVRIEGLACMAMDMDTDTPDPEFEACFDLGDGPVRELSLEEITTRLAPYRLEKKH